MNKIKIVAFCIVAMFSASGQAQSTATVTVLDDKTKLVCLKEVAKEYTETKKTIKICWEEQNGNTTKIQTTETVYVNSK